MVKVADPAETEFGIEEVVIFVYIQRLVVPASFFFIELVVDTVGPVADMAVLRISEGP